jgi:tRNA (guanine-N7-)-methyltransferase
MTEPRPPIDASHYTIEYPNAPLDWRLVFGNDQRVELEVGSGKGLFLANAGMEHADRNYLGVELSRKYAAKAAERVAKRKLHNVRIVAGDARRLLREFVPVASLSAVHIYFPDPWWKKRHKKRRVFCSEFVADVARVLRPGGEFCFSTDVEEYFGVMQELMGTRAEFRTQAPEEPKAPEHDLDYLTNFERKYRIEGRAIFRGRYHRA